MLFTPHQSKQATSEPLQRHFLAPELIEFWRDETGELTPSVTSLPLTLSAGPIESRTKHGLQTSSEGSPQPKTPESALYQSLQPDWHRRLA